jgi:cyclic pyranopterin phosphate synthase
MGDFVDKYGRRVKSLRISLTSRCNLRCIYCHNEGESNVNGKVEITPETIHALAGVAAKHGVDKIKFSGGEPLLRCDLTEILSGLPHLKDVSLTTNGTLLSQKAGDLAEAGLHRVNISLDTLKPETYNQITRTKSYHSKVLDGIHAAIDAGLTPVKINMVLLKGLNDDEIWDMIRFVKQYREEVILQLIELMDFQQIPQYQINMDMIQQKLEQEATHIKERSLHRRKKYYLDGVEIELVRPLDNSTFCANCSRLRVTCDGKLKTCLLQNNNLVDIKNKSPEEIEQLLEQTIQQREPYYKPENTTLSYAAQRT